MDITITLSDDHVTAIAAKQASQPGVFGADAAAYVATVIKNDIFNVVSFLPDVDALDKQLQQAQNARNQKLKTLQDGVTATAVVGTTPPNGKPAK